MKSTLTISYGKRALLLLVCALTMVGNLTAVPAYPGWQTKNTPDGGTITVRLVGDEFYHYWQTEDGQLALEQADGTFIVSSDPLPTPTQVSTRRRASAMYQSRPHKAIGKVTLAPKGLVILVQFPDVPFQTGNDSAAFSAMLNHEGYHYGGATGSARDYFYAQSGGTYTPEFDVFGPITMPHNLIYYGEQDFGPDGAYRTEDDGDNDKYMADFVMDAVYAAHEAGCDFSQYDSDRDDYVDIIYFFYAGKGQAAGGGPETIWPHNWSLTGALYKGRTRCTSSCEYYAYQDAEGNIVRNLPVYDGKYIDNYVCSAELKHDDQRSGIGTLCHEFSHVLGLPDYYDTDYGVNHDYKLTPGMWSIMDYGSYNNDEMTPPNYSIFDKYFMGWATPKFLAKNIAQDVVMTTGYDDAYQVTGKSAQVPYSYTDTVYYIENRQNTGWDAYLPGHGMLVWQVVYDADWWAANKLNNLQGKPRYTVKSASDEVIYIGQDLLPNNDPFPGVNQVHRFLPFQGCSFTSISETSEGNITFSFNSGVVCRPVSATVTGCESYVLSDDCVPETMNLVVTFVPEDDLYDIESLSVKVGGTELTRGTEYDLSEDHRTLTVYSAAFAAHSGEVTINAAWVKTYVPYTFYRPTDHCSLPADGIAKLGEPLNLEITPDPGYSLSLDNSCWTVTSDVNNTLVLGVDYSYDRTTNTLTIFDVAGDLYIMPHPYPVDFWYADGELYEEQTCGENIYPPTKPGDCSNGRKFVGWCTNKNYHHLTEAPAFVQSGQPKEEVSTSFYAVYAQAGAPEIVSETGYINYSTKCNEPRAYVVIFRDDDGTLLGTQVVEAGQAATAPIVHKDCYNLTWDKTFNNVTADMTVTAVWVTQKPHDWHIESEDTDQGVVIFTPAPTCSDLTLTFRAEAKEGYQFIEWSDGVTDKQRTITLTKDTVITARFAKLWKITWQNHDGELFYVEWLPNGATPKYEGETPTKEPSATKTYTFKEWYPDPEIFTATEDRVYTARFLEIPRKFTVTFVDEDDNTLWTYRSVDYGGSVKEPHVTPRTCFEYSWSRTDFNNVTEDMIVKLVWTPTSFSIAHSVTSDDESKGTVHVVKEPTCEDNSFIVRADAKDGYAFLKWSDGSTDNPHTVYVYGEKHLTATWTTGYKITWLNFNDTILRVDWVAPGVMPKFGEDPVRAADPQYTYEFRRWNPTVAAADGDAVYTAEYWEWNRYYTVRFQYADGTEIETKTYVPYGSKTVKAPTSKVTVPPCKTLRWDKDFSYITKDLVVTAIFDDIKIPDWTIDSDDESQGTVQIIQEPTCDNFTLKFKAVPVNGGDFIEWSDGDWHEERTITLTKDTVIHAKWVKKWAITWRDYDGTDIRTDYVRDGYRPIYGTPSPQRPSTAQYNYIFDGWNPSVSAAKKDMVYTATYTEHIRNYAVTYYGPDGNYIVELYFDYGTRASTPSVDVPACKEVRWEPTSDLLCVTKDFEAHAFLDDKPSPYTATITTSDAEKGTVTVTQPPTCAEPTVKFRADAKTGYQFLKWSDNNTENPREITLTENIELQALWQEKTVTWTITWKNGDRVLETDYNVPDGEMPVYNGATPTKDATQQYTYTFSGWTPAVVAATENATYTATFDATLRQYTVTFKNGEKTEKVELVDYGSSATPPEIEVPDCKKLEWEPDYSNITGDLTVNAQWSDITTSPYTATISSADEKQGTVTITQQPTCADPTVKFRADAKTGYEFLKWSDNNTDNPREITLEANLELTAQFVAIVVEPIEITETTDISKLGVDASTELEVAPAGLLTVTTPTTIHAITLEYSESGHAQLSGITNLTVDEIEVKMQFPTPVGPLDGQWFAIAVPFAVSMNAGIRYQGSDDPAIPGTDFLVYEYDGAQRAATQRGWKSVASSATLYPGRMYMFSMADHATWYLKAANPKSLTEPKSVDMAANVSTIGDHHSGWNGIANTLFTNASGAAAGVTYATTYDNKAGVYVAQNTGSYVFGAAVPFFVQSPGDRTLDFTDESATPAPLRAQREQSSAVASVTLTDAEGNYTDQAFWTVNADKQDVYTIGSDLQKMQVANASVPQISILAYNMKLSAYEAPFDGTATIPVSLYAPAEGTYIIAVSNVPDDLSVLLMQNGSLIWDITSTSYAAYLQAGENTGYALNVQRIKQIGTGVNNTGNSNAEHTVQKVLFNERIYIIRDGKTYGITGECVNQ